MQQFDYIKYLKNNPLRKNIDKKNINEAFENFGGYMDLKPLSEVGINTPRVDYLNPIEDEDDDYEQQSPMDRMKGLINQNHLKMFVTGARGMMGDLTEDGFEPDEIYEFLMDIFKKID